MRRAAARAAMRRGSRTTTCPPSARPASRTAGGTRVVLPAPAGAVSTAQGFCPRAATSCGRTASMGSGVRLTTDFCLTRGAGSVLLVRGREERRGYPMVGWLRRLLAGTPPPPPVRHPLEDQANSPDPEARHQAAVQLGEVAEPWAVGPLVRLLQDSHTKVRDAAKVSLRQ